MLALSRFFSTLLLAFSIVSFFILILNPVQAVAIDCAALIPYEAACRDTAPIGTPNADSIDCEKVCEEDPACTYKGKKICAVTPTTAGRGCQDILQPTSWTKCEDHPDSDAFGPDFTIDCKTACEKQPLPLLCVYRGRGLCSSKSADANDASAICSGLVTADCENNLEVLECRSLCERNDKNARCLYSGPGVCVAATDLTGGQVNPVRTPPPGYKGPIPDCAFSYEGCREVNNLLQLVINVGQQIFGIIGSFALLMFIYGGFVMVTAAGSPEKFKKGTGILVAAIVGILISFGAYLLVDLVLEGLNVTEEFKGLN